MSFLRASRLGLVFGTFAALLLGAGTARAAIVEWRLDGTITGIAAENASVLSGLGVSLGTPFTASIRYQSSTPPASPTVGLYLDPAIHVEFEAGDYSVALSPPAHSEAHHTPGALLFNFSAEPVSVALFTPGFALDLVGVDPPNGESLPVVPPVRAGTERTFSVFAGGATPAIVSKSFAISYSVPEPSPAALVVLAGAALAWVRLRGRESRCR
jgi:hypothetical protein